MAGSHARSRAGTALLRPARAFDAAACAAIVNDWIDATPWMPRIHDAPTIAWFYREHVFRQQRVTVAERGGEVAGFLALDLGRACVTSLYLHPAARGEGIGARLLGDAKAQAARLSLWAFQANTGALRFYRREGFREGRRSDGENEERMPDIEFLWDAPGAAAPPHVGLRGTHGT